jgi:hypothetical protein
VKLRSFGLTLTGCVAIVKNKLATHRCILDTSTLTIDEFGHKRWRLPNGKWHRVDGPAIERVNGDKQWCLHGKWHRVDGPAIEYADGTKRWCLNDINYEFDEWLNANNLISEEEKLMLKLTYG